MHIINRERPPPSSVHPPFVNGGPVCFCIFLARSWSVAPRALSPWFKVRTTSFSPLPRSAREDWNGPAEIHTATPKQPGKGRRLFRSSFSFAYSRDNSESSLRVFSARVQTSLWAVWSIP
jgi:hypothetical protein